MRTSRSVAAVLATLFVFAAAPAGASAHKRWVGMGDSFAAGPLIPSQTLNPLGCLRSTRNFARLAAARRAGRSSTSRAAARRPHMSEPQSTDAGTNPPQFNALTAQRGRLGAVRRQRHRVQRDPPELRDGQPVRSAVPQPLHGNGVDQIVCGSPRPLRRSTRCSRASGRRRRARGSSSSTTPRSCPHTGNGCWPQVPLAWADVPYVRGMHEGAERDARASAWTRRRNTAPTCGSSTPTAPSVGRDACRSSSTRWVEPLVPGNTAAPFHPNARGMAAFAPLVAAASN